MGRGRLTIILVTQVDIIDHGRISLDDSLGELIVHISSIQKTQVKSILPHSTNMVHVPAKTSARTTTGP